MDWEPPIEGSCFLGTDEQCVEKATSLLSALRQQIVSLKDVSTTKSPDRPSSRVGDFEKPITPLTVRSPLKSTEQQQLVVKGSSTGQKKLVNITDVRSTPPGSTDNKLDWSKADNVIAKSLSLIMKLEKDRCDTMKQLETEKLKVSEMRQKLDEKARERLRLLADIVQNEHEQCLQDMLEMKWHVGFEGRHLKQIQDDVRLVVDKNLELKKNVEGLSKQFTLLEQKIDSQTNAMAEITHKQLETNKKLKNKQSEHSIAKRKAHKVREDTEAEIKQMDRMIFGLKTRLESAQKDYEEAIEQQERILQSINLAKERMENFDRENDSKKEILENTKLTRNVTSDRVGALKDNSFHIQVEIEGLKGENSQLSLTKRECFTKLNNESTCLQTKLQQKTKDMRDGRERNENFIHSIEEMKEQSVVSKKKTEEAQKSTRSAERELTKVDKQLAVIHEQTELSRKNHRELVLELRENEDAYDHEEYTLKTTVQSIKEELNKETKVKRIYQGKVAANTEDLEKMKAEHSRNYKQLKGQADDAEKGENLEQLILNQTTMKYNERIQLKDELSNKVTELKNEILRLETELGDAIKSLIPKEAELSQSAAEINERTKMFKEKASLLSDRIKDIKTSQSAIDRMTNEILTGIDELKLQKEELDAKMTMELEEDESWKREYEEIANFSKEAEEKFSNYKVERQEYLEQLEANVGTMMTENKKLASDYELLRDKHATIKGQVVRALERTSILEHGVRDKNQLLMLQRRLMETLKIHYEHRGSTGRKAVKKVKSTMEGTKCVVKGIETEFTRTLNDMQIFLKHIDSEQKQIRIMKKENGLIEQEQIKTTRTVIPTKTKSVSFTLPVECPS